MSTTNSVEQKPLPALVLAGFENVYHKMIEEIEDYAIILLDTEGYIRNWNKGAEKIKQYTEAEAIGMNFRQFYRPEDLAAGIPERMLSEARSRGRAIHEGWRLRKDKSGFWGSITITALHGQDGEVIGFSKVTRDLTERKIAEDHLKDYAAGLERANENLRKSEERYHQMIAEVQDYAIILLNEKGNIQNWNTGAQKIKQYSAEEIIGKNFRIFYLPEDQATGLPERLIATAASQGKATHEGWRVRKNGSRFWGSIVITALHNQKGEIIGYSKVTRDLTERKLAEDKLEKYLRELEAQNRELERFAYIASHDLQEPLRKIRTFIEIIQKNLSNPELVEKFFTKINVSAQRMSELIKAVLNYSRLGKNDDRITNVDLNNVLKNVIDDFELNIQEKEATIRSEVLPSITADELQINQLFFNLIGNALKFSKGRPEINITCTVVDSKQIKDEPEGVPAGRYLALIFADNGIGFEPQYGKKIFSLFQRLHGMQEYAGTGIGLALCKRIMENHGGYITAESEPGMGARFYLYFRLND